MTNMVKVAKLHLVDRVSYTWLVWGVLAIAFLVNLAIFAVLPVDQSPEGAVVALGGYGRFAGSRSEPNNGAGTPMAASPGLWGSRPSAFDGSVGIRPDRAPSPAALPQRPAPPAR